MSKKPPKIVVASGVTVDWLYAPPIARTGRSKDSLHIFRRLGGAAMLAKFVGWATGHQLPLSVDINDSPFHFRPPFECVHQLLHLARFPSRIGETGSCSRVEKKELVGLATGCRRVTADITDPDIVVLDDSLGQYQNTPAPQWGATLSGVGKSWVVVNVGRSTGATSLWEELTANHSDRLIAIIDAEDLRADLKIQRGISWEMVAQETLAELTAKRPNLMRCRGLIVRYGLEGALVRDLDRTFLIYEPAAAEGDYTEEYPGEMVDAGSAFAAAIVAAVASSGLAALCDGAERGLQACRRLLAAGFGGNPDDHERTWEARLFGPPIKGECRFGRVAVPAPDSNRAGPSDWSILREQMKGDLTAFASEFVRRGDAALKDVPVLKMGKFKTVDRAEIEMYRRLRQRMLEAMKSPTGDKGLIIGVFGRPGSGKSYGVIAVLASLPSARVVVLPTFNMTDYSKERLQIDLHKVRDVVISGKIPAAFFDEFDSKNESEQLGWLVKFLQILEDGVFTDNAGQHPVGKAIFVFGGGTSETFEDFKKKAKDHPGSKAQDFTSRIDGHIDVVGPNPDSGDEAYVVRRATLLRSLLEQYAPGLINDQYEIEVEANLLKAIREGITRFQAISFVFLGYLNLACLPSGSGFRRRIILWIALSWTHDSLEDVSRS